MILVSTHPSFQMRAKAGKRQGKSYSSNELLCCLKMRAGLTALCFHVRASTNGKPMHAKERGSSTETQGEPPLQRTRFPVRRPRDMAACRDPRSAYSMTSAVPMAAMSSLLAGRGGSPGKLGRACKERPAGSAPRSNPMLLSMVNQRGSAHLQQQDTKVVITPLPSSNAGDWVCR